MVDNKLAEWIKSEEAQGYTEEQLRGQLEKQGYKDKDIDEAVKGLKKPTIMGSLKTILISLIVFDLILLFFHSAISKLIYWGNLPGWFYNDILILIFYILPTVIISVLASLKLSKLNCTKKNSFFSGFLIGFLTPALLMLSILILEGANEDKLMLLTIITFISSIFMSSLSLFIRQINIKKYPPLVNLKWFPEESKVTDLPELNIKDSFKPTLLKLLFPLLVLILIIVSTSVNFFVFPGYGESLCKQASLDKSYKNISIQWSSSLHSYNVDAEKVVSLTKELDSNKYESQKNMFDITNRYVIPLIYGNFYFLELGVYNLNPFFPLPCESMSNFPLIGEISNNLRCYNLISQESYGCISREIVGGMSSFFGITYKNKYIPFNFFDFFVNALILLAISYLLVCLISFCINKVQHNNYIIKIISALILLVVPFIFAVVINKFYPLVYYLIFIPLSVSILIKSGKIQKIFFYSVVTLIVILLVAGLFLIQLNIKDRMSSEPKQVNINYFIGQCQNTRVLNLTETQNDKSIPTNDTDKIGGVCDNPACGVICGDYCKGSNQRYIFTLRGDKPSCVCGCWFTELSS